VFLARVPVNVCSQLWFIEQKHAELIDTIKHLMGKDSNELSRGQQDKRLVLLSKFCTKGLFDNSGGLFTGGPNNRPVLLGETSYGSMVQVFCAMLLCSPVFRSLNREKKEFRLRQRGTHQFL